MALESKTSPTIALGYGSGAVCPHEDGNTGMVCVIQDVLFNVVQRLTVDISGVSFIDPLTQQSCRGVTLLDPVPCPQQ